jgi:phage RecT family recombinase
MTDSPDTITGDAQPEPPRLTPAEIRQRTIVQLLRTYEPVVDKLLTGTGQTRETFMAQIANAMRVQPKLWECDPATVLGAALRCAQLGMAPNDGTNRAWIIPRKGEATFQLGYGGVLELARRAAPGLEFDGRPVYPNDDFELEYGNDHFRHVPWFARKDVRHTEAGGDAFLWYGPATPMAASICTCSTRTVSSTTARSRRAAAARSICGVTPTTRPLSNR